MPTAMYTLRTARTIGSVSSVDGAIQTVVGSGRQGESGNGPVLSVNLDFPHGVAIDAMGTLYVADTFNHRIRRLDPDGVARVVAGTGKQEFIGDGGPAIQAGLGAPDSLAIDADGNIYIADRANWRVRKITKDGSIYTIAGNQMPMAADLTVLVASSPISASRGKTCPHGRAPKLSASVAGSRSS